MIALDQLKKEEFESNENLLRSKKMTIVQPKKKCAFS